MAEPYFAAPVAPSGKPMKFKSRDDLVTFCRDWINQWQWVRQGNWSSVAPIYGSFCNQLQSAINPLTNQASAPQLEENAKRNLTNCFSQWSSGNVQGVLGPQDPKALFVLKIHEKHGPEAAVACLTVLLKGTLSLGNIPHVPMTIFWGTWEGFLFKEGFTDPTPYDGKILTEFMAAEEKAFSELGTNFQEIISQSGQSLQASQESVQAAKDEAQRQAEIFNQMVASSKAELEGIKRSLKEELALRAPVEYWQKKAQRHAELASNFGKAIGGLTLLLFAAILGLIWFLFWLNKGVQPQIWEMASSALITGLLIYLLRIVVRVQLSHLHLATDAEQRAVMVQTYLSLEHHDEIMTKEDRHLILEALFRPVGAGLVKDDQSSLGLLEFIMSKKPGS
jgi:hypothetical protein